MKEVPSGYHASKPLQRLAVELLARFFATEIKLYGTENLKKVQQLIHSGNRIIFVANHLSHADFTVFHQSLKRNSFSEIGDKTIPLSGLRIETTPVAKLFTPAYPRIIIWPPTEEPKNSEERARKYTMDKQMLYDSRKRLEYGSHLFIFPEGTRSKTGSLGYGNPGVTSFFNLVDNTFVVPVGISGTDKILPPKEFMPVSGHCNVSVGEPINASDLKEKFQSASKAENRLNMITFVMKEIARCLPPTYQGVYSNITYAKT